MCNQWAPTKSSCPSFYCLQHSSSHGLNLVSSSPESLLRLHPSALDKPNLIANPLQPARERRLLRHLQGAEPIKLDAFLFERVGRLSDMLPQRFGAFMIAAVVEG